MNDNSLPSSQVLPTSQAQNQILWGKPMEQMKTTEVARSIIYQSDAMSNLMKMIDRVAPSNANVLVLGESGTGKELLARAVHERSLRKNKPFVAINCGPCSKCLERCRISYLEI